MRPSALCLAVAALAVAGAAGRAGAQGAPSRPWRPDERLVLTDLSRVTAVAASQQYVFAATREALAVYDRTSLALADVLGVTDGYPGQPVTTMVADPNDDTAWLGGPGYWAAYHAFGRRWDVGALPGSPDLVALDADDPIAGAYYHTTAGWYQVPRNGVMASAVPAGPAHRIAPATPAELLRAAPALDAVRMQLERDDQMRMTPMTAAALSTIRDEAFIGTAGNGVFRVDLTSYRADRLPAGILGTSVGAVAAERGRVCAAADLRRSGGQRGVTCFTPALEDFQYLRGGFSGLPGTQVRRLLLTRRAAWLATDAGAVRVPRNGGAARQFTERNGLQSANVGALAPAPDGVWVGSASGVAVAPDDDGHATAVPVADVPGGALALAVTDDTLWIGTPNGLLVLMPGSTAPLVVQPDLRVFRAPVTALAVKGDTILAALGARLAVREGGSWRVVDPPGTAIGRITAATSDAAGFWLGGAQGAAFYQPARGVWRALTSTGDLPLPVADVAAGGAWVWFATAGGLVRLDRRVLGP